jgi:hypothetical protein
VSKAILVVDDEVDMRALARMRLETFVSSSCHTATADCGASERHEESSSSVATRTACTTLARAGTWLSS